MNCTLFTKLLLLLLLLPVCFVNEAIALSAGGPISLSLPPSAPLTSKSMSLSSMAS